MGLGLGLGLGLPAHKVELGLVLLVAAAASAALIAGRRARHGAWCDAEEVVVLVQGSAYPDPEG